MTTTTRTRTAPAIAHDAEDFSGKVRTALLKSVALGVGEVRVKVADPSDRVTVRKVQKRVQGIGYSAGFNANFRVVLTGSLLIGTVQDLTRDLLKPGQTEPTVKTPGTRQTFEGWTPKRVEAWRKSHPVKSGSDKVTPGTKVSGKRSTGSKVTARKSSGTKVTRKVTKVTTTAQTPVPDSLKGITATGPVDTTTVTTTTK